MTAHESEQLHEELVTLLAAYVDGEATELERTRVEAHLVGCRTCQQLYQRQAAVVRRLAREPVGDVPLEVQRRLSQALWRTATGTRAPAAARRRAALTWGGWVLSGVLAATLLLSHSQLLRGLSPLPMVEDAVADYQATMSREIAFERPDLGGLSKAVGFPVTPLEDSRFQLLGGWVSDIRGTPAAVLAYRWKDRVVLQYQVTPELFFRQPALRDAVRGGGRYLAQAQAHAVLAWSQGPSGQLLVTDAPLREVEALRL